LNFGSFKASNGWLQKFKTRHNILRKTICGESADAPKETADKILTMKNENVLGVKFRNNA
jgi:hypothetical protein